MWETWNFTAARFNLDSGQRSLRRLLYGTKLSTLTTNKQTAAWEPAERPAQQKAAPQLPHGCPMSPHCGCGSVPVPSTPPTSCLVLMPFQLVVWLLLGRELMATKTFFPCVYRKHLAPIMIQASQCFSATNANQNCQNLFFLSLSPCAAG